MRAVRNRHGARDVLVASLVTLVAAVILSAAGAAQPPVARPASDAEISFFESRIRPILAKHCYACHSGVSKIVQGGLRLDRADLLEKGGDSGAVVAPGRPDESLLIRAVRYGDAAMRMPPAGRIPQPEIDLLAEWVRRGAHFPAARAPGEGTAGGAMSLEQGRKFWSLRPLARKPPAPARRAGWARTRIDAYLLPAMEQAGLAPSPEADRPVLIRRLYFDLIGLPPAPEEIDAFVADQAPDAYEKLVERLLASPHYGERWGRHWLDLVRYCDVPEQWAQTEAQAWRYRDWVVDALNRDVPYDRFVMQQLAADRMPGSAPADLAALGFLGLSPTYWKELKLAPDVIKLVVAEEWEERVQAVSGAILGLTIACARCHDHKTDPITTRDYYALAGVFASVRQVARPLLPAAEAEKVREARELAKRLQEQVEMRRAAAAREGADRAKAAEEADRLAAKAAQIRRETAGFDAPTVYAVEDAFLEVLPDGPDRTRLEYQMGVGRDVPMQTRGNPARPGPVVPRSLPAVLYRSRPTPFTQGSGRLELAEAIFRDAAPLVARVIVNRIWRHHFGRGIVDTPSNFGVSGDRPTHPELLDDLAARFIQAGWSLKWLHREIVRSAAYRQTSREDTRRRVADPENRLLARMSRRRLEVEPWRDAILKAAGTLEARIGGEPQELAERDSVRRTIYGIVRRRDLNDLLRLYDFPDPTTHSPARFHTTTPLQQLYVLNSAFIGKQAAALAERVRLEAPDSLSGQIVRAYRLLLGREPSGAELAAAEGFLRPTAAALRSPDLGALMEVLLAANELIYVD